MPASRRPGGALVLAAGFSSRFGSDKRAHKLPDGTPLLLATLDKYKTFSQLAVVIRDPEDEPAQWLRAASRDVTLIVAADARLGMAHSLAAGIAGISEWSYAFIVLADMPFVAETTLAQLRSTMEASTTPSIIVPTFNDRPGHPVGFDVAFFEQLRTLKGDEGARSILQRCAPQIVEVPVTDPGIHQDIDRPPTPD